MSIRRWLIVPLTLHVTSAIVADDKLRQPPTAAEIKLFESKIRPVLVKHCYSCHSEKSGKSEGGLRVDSKAGLRTGGNRGPAVVPGDLEASWLLAAMSHADPDLKMPPKKARLPDAVLADFKTWIKSGAVDPRDGAKAKQTWPNAEAARNHWAYQPIESAPPPQSAEAWGKRPLDAYIRVKQTAAGLSPSPDAPPHVLLRRLHFDLVGLPPSAVALAEFQQRVTMQGLDAALATEADALLDSKHFGEKWGRHWLDVARFGESSGGEANISFPYAWRYRDYVIDCVNADVPFDRFLIEQIAGDLLPAENDKERARLLIATGFLAVGPKPLDASAKQFRADLIDEQIDTLTRAVTANSVACARCHDHKFDPFSMRDYYALAGVFASTKTYFGTAVSPSNRMAGDPLVLPRVEGLKVYHKSIPAKKVRELKEKRAALQQEKKELMAAGKFGIRDALRIFWQTGGIEGNLEKVDENGHALPLAMGTKDRERPQDAPLLANGDVNKPGEPVPRGLPKILFADEPFPIDKSQSGRSQLARWLTHPQHPLTKRVFVNRVWRHLMGAGLVRTVDNFGTTGERPSHPRLLDHLAARFQDHGWSLKKMVREIVLSRTYRQASDFNREAFLKDPENRLRWRMSKRRMPAEDIRDGMLAVSGELNRDRAEASLVGRVIGDRPISLIGLNKKVPRDLDGSTHRSVYLPVIRDRLPEVLDLFDFAEPSMVTGDRETTNVPVQALYLMNSSFVSQRAAAFAKRMQAAKATHRGRVRLAFQLCFTRLPDAEEEARSLKYLKRAAEQTEAPGVALASFCQALLCTAEFRNLD